MSYSSDESMNEVDNDDDQNPVKLFHLFLESNNLREARKLIRKYEAIQRLSPKELNQQYQLTNYRFTSRNGVLSIDSTKALNNKVSFENQQTNFNNEITRFKETHNILIHQILDRLRSLEDKNNMISDVVNEQSNTINQIVAVLNGQ